MNAPASDLSSASSPARNRKSAAESLVLRLALIAPLALFANCSGSGYKAANYSAAKLATPAHNMSQRDYPFDAKGNYRKDWVKGGSTRPGSASSASSRSTASTTTRSAPAPTRSSSSSAPRTITPPRTTVPASRSTVTRSTSTYRPASTPASRPAPAPAPAPKARYHTVSPKQTLWAISQMYGTSVEALQRANGLSGNNIRIGQTLRIP